MPYSYSYFTIRIVSLLCSVILGACTTIPASIHEVKEDAQPLKIVQVFPTKPFVHEAWEGFTGRAVNVPFEAPDDITLVIESIALMTPVFGSGNKVDSLQLRMEYHDGRTIYHPFPIPNNLMMGGITAPTFSNRWETRLYVPAASSMLFLITTKTNNTGGGLVPIAHIIISGYEVPLNSPSLAP